MDVMEPGYRDENVRRIVESEDTDGILAACQLLLTEAQGRCERAGNQYAQNRALQAYLAAAKARTWLTAPVAVPTSGS